MTADEALNLPSTPLVEVHGNDYSYKGVVVSVFDKISGAIRVVVEDDNGRLFIHNPQQISRCP